MSNIIEIESISQVHEFIAYDKPKHPLVSLIRYGDSFTNVDFGDDKYVLNLYQINLKDGVNCSLIYGRNNYDFNEGTLVFTKPGQVLQFDDSHEIDDSSDAWVLLFHPDLLRKSLLGQTIGDYTFFGYEANEALHISDDEKRMITDIVSKIELEYSSNIDQHSQKLIISNIELLLDYCARYYDRQFYTRTNLNQDFVTQFEALLRDYFKTEKQVEFGLPSVKYCGETMGMSPNYLSDLLKKETGRSAQDHIHQFIIEKAKNMLLTSKSSVSEVAYGLGFEYPQHFSKLFKKKTNYSPKEYRNLN